MKYEIHLKILMATGLAFGYDPIVFVQNDTFHNGIGKYITTWETLGKQGDWSIIMTDFVASQNGSKFAVQYGGVQRRTRGS